MKHLNIPIIAARVRKANDGILETSTQLVQSWWLITGLIWVGFVLTGKTAASLPPAFVEAMSWAFVVIAAGATFVGCTMGSVTLAIRFVRRLEMPRRNIAQ